VSAEASAAANIAVSTKTLLGFFVGSEPTTLRRLHGLLNWTSDQVAASEQPFGAFGVCVVSDDAFAAGAASIPGPFTDSDSDLWVLHKYIFTDFTVATAIGVQARGGNQYELSSKAMRKFTPDETVAVMIENGSATHQGQFWWALRALFVQSSR